MAATHARAARRERQAAELLGSMRVHRRRYERAPDVEPVRLPDGTVLVAEAKTRKTLPRWLVGAVDQARGYLPGCVPLVALSELGGEPLAVIPLRDLARLLGLQPPDTGAQLTLAPAASADAVRDDPRPAPRGWRPPRPQAVEHHAAATLREDRARGHASWGPQRRGDRGTA